MVMFVFNVNDDVIDNSNGGAAAGFAAISGAKPSGLRASTSIVSIVTIKPQL